LGAAAVAASPQPPLPLGAFTERHVSETCSHDLFVSNNESKRDVSGQGLFFLQISLSRRSEYEDSAIDLYYYSYIN
jgi:hypothetical protein